MCDRVRPERVISDALLRPVWLKHLYSYFLGSMRRQLDAISLLAGAGVRQIRDALSISRD